MEYRKALKLRDTLAAPILARLRNDRTKAPHRSRSLLEHFENHLFDPEFRLEEAYEQLNLDPDELRREFSVLTGMAPRKYARTLRLAMAERLLTHTKLRINTVSELSGYASHKTFDQAFRASYGTSPSSYRQQQSTILEVIFPADLVQKLNEARLEEHEVQALVTYLRTHHPQTLDARPPLHFESAEDITTLYRSVSLQELERLQAEHFWSVIQHLPRSAQEERIRQTRSFQTDALFQVLLQASRAAGRKNRLQGLHIAELALTAALTTSQPDLSTGTNALWAQAWAQLANSRRLAFQLEQADLAFIEAEKFFSPEDDSLIQAEFLSMKAVLRMYQRCFEAGLELISQALDILRNTPSAPLQAKVLLVQAILLRHTGHTDQGISALTRVLGILPTIGNPIHLGVAAHYTLARYHREVGEYSQVKRILKQLRHWAQRYRLRVYDVYITWFEGRVALDLGHTEQAEQLLSAAQSGFFCTDSPELARLVGLDLAIAYASQKKKTQTLETIRDVLTVLEQWREHHPLVATAWRTLQRTAMTEQFSLSDLIDVRAQLESFQDDPASQQYFDFSAIAV